MCLTQEKLKTQELQISRQAAIISQQELENIRQAKVISRLEEALNNDRKCKQVVQGTGKTYCKNRLLLEFLM